MVVVVGTLTFGLGAEVVTGLLVVLVVLVVLLVVTCLTVDVVGFAADVAGAEVFDAGARPRRSSAARSATVMMYADGFVAIMPGKMLASTTKRLSVPYTLQFVSTTAVPPVRPSSVPILQVPIQ